MVDRAPTEGSLFRADEGNGTLQALARTVPHGVYRVDADGRFVDVDEEFADAVGRTREGLVGASLVDLLSDASVECFDRAAAHRREGTAPGEPVTLSLACGDAGYRTAEFRIHPLDDGGLLGTMDPVDDVSESADGTRVGPESERGAAGDDAGTPDDRERQLREDARRYRTLAESFPNGIVTLFDHDLEYTVASGLGFDRIPVTPADLEGEHVRDVWDEETANTLEPAFRDALDGERTRVELEYVGREWVVHATPVRDDDGEVVGAMTMAQDVTERREAERQLRERERQLSTLISNVPGMMYRCENDRGWPMEFVSESAAEITGYAPETLEDGEVSFGEEVVVEEDRDELWAAIQSDVSEGEPFTETYRIETADGQRRWVTDHGRGVFEDGELVALEGVIIDVTDRKRQQRALEHSERRYRTLVDQFPNGAVALFDEEFRYRVAGGKILDALGIAPEDVEGSTIYDRYDEETLEAIEPRFEAALAGEESSFDLEEHGRHFRIHTLPVRDGDGDVFAGMIVARDVTERKQAREELRESERKFRQVAENLDQVVWMSTPGKEGMLYVNPAYEELWGRPRDELYDHPQSFLDGVHPEDRDRVREALPQQAAGNYDEEYRVVRPDGEVRWVHDRAVPIENDDGEVYRIVGIVDDVTDRKERERYLEDAKAQLEAATEAGAIGTWEWNIKEDHFVAGTSFARQFGVDPDAAREGVSLDRFVESIHEADRPRVQRAIEETVEACGEYEEEYRVRNADGELRWVVARGHVETDEEGNPETFPGALADITERKRAEQRLDRHRKQLQTLFRVLPVGVVVAEPDGGLVEANQTAREIWGGDVFDADDVGEYEQYTGWWADSGDRVETDEWTMARVLDGEEVSDPDVVEIETADGQRRIIMIHGMPVRDEDGNVVRGVVTQTDITERREYRRKLEESNERLEQFAYAASHDLQEPLRMVSSYLSLIEKRYAETLDEDGMEFLEYAVDGAERMREMIDALLEYSRVDSRGDPFEPVDLNDVFADVRQDFEMRIAESNAEVTVEPLPTVEGDASQLRQVFSNLLSNAIEYSGDEPPTVHVSAERRGDECVVAVRDEGVGMDPQHADKAFEVFERLQSASDGSGTGIGLALAERIVERHGGDMWVETAPGEGSTFYFSVPVSE